MLPNQPILYSFRRCPYAIRARLAIRVSGIQVELREVLLADKPEEMLACSAKGTVPVLLLPDGSVIDESWDIMLWALKQNDPEHWLPSDAAVMDEIAGLVEQNDGEFKQSLDRYKYADRFPEQPMETYRQQGELFLQHLEARLAQTRYVVGAKLTVGDMALLPFIRQFANVDREWFDQTPYLKLRAWLELLLESPLFSDVMIKIPRWVSGNPAHLF
ncbi:MAG: glutathione S-transferase [Acidiferrobacterales bacterium]